jgi:hypothetical protein
MKKSRWLKRGTKQKLWIATMIKVAKVKLRVSRDFELSYPNLLRKAVNCI